MSYCNGNIRSLNYLKWVIYVYWKYNSQICLSCFLELLQMNTHEQLSRRFFAQTCSQQHRDLSSWGAEQYRHLRKSHFCFQHIGTRVCTITINSQIESCLSKLTFSSVSSTCMAPPFHPERIVFFLFRMKKIKRKQMSGWKSVVKHVEDTDEESLQWY